MHGYNVDQSFEAPEFTVVFSQDEEVVVTFIDEDDLERNLIGTSLTQTPSYLILYCPDNYQ